MTLDTLGRLSLQVEMVLNPHRLDPLTLGLAADQTYLSGWIEQLDLALQNFPTQI